MRLFAATEHHQERRALARRGDVTHLQRRQCDTAGSREPLLGVMTAAAREMRIPLRIRHVHPDWLTPAALGARCRFARKNAICAAHQLSAQKTPFAVHKRTFLRSGDRQPAVVAELRDYRGEMRLFAATEHRQERRPSARRGSVTHLQRRQRDTAGLRQPLLSGGWGQRCGWFTEVG